MEKEAILALKDETILHGKGFGAETEITGEVVFNTSMVGYPELLTDPSYYEQIVVMTYPIIGSYGVPAYSITDQFGVPLHFESDSIKVKGYAVHSLSQPSHWSSKKNLDQWLSEQNVPGIFGIDTRELTKKLRTKGTMLGILKVSGKFIDIEKIKKKLKLLEDPNKRNLVKGVSVTEPVFYKAGDSINIVVIDCGTKFGIVRSLLSRNVNVIRVPYDYPLQKILNLDPRGIMISNGPGDPKKCDKTIETARGLLETELPTMGICLGNQILALAGGGDTYKLKFGHRAINHPCIDIKTRRCYITTQNHGYTIEEKSLKDTDFEVSFVNVNDKTVEGMVHKKKRIFGVQWHPESSPGPYDTKFLFDDFIAEVMHAKKR